MNKILIAAIVAGGLYFLLSKPQQLPPPGTGTQPPIDPKQARTAAQIRALQQWILTMVALYGNVRAHWQPGGIFYNVPKQILDDINIKPPAPGEGDGSGWA